MYIRFAFTYNIQTASLQSVKAPTNECAVYDIKLSYSEATALEISGMRSTPLLPLHQASLWPVLLAPDRVLSMAQIELFDIETGYKQMTLAKGIVSNRTVRSFICQSMTYT